MAKRFSEPEPPAEPSGDLPPAESPSADSPPPADAKPPEAAPAGPELLTPNEWAHRKGLLFRATEKQPWVEEHSKGFHAAASQLHGWTQHAHNEQNPEKAIRLLEADYDAALAAAGEFPAKPAHVPALAPNFPNPNDTAPDHLKKAWAAAAQKPGA